MPRESSITGWKALYLGNTKTFPFKPFWLACGLLGFAAGLSSSFLINFCFLILKWVFKKLCSRTEHAHVGTDAPLPTLEGPSRLWVIGIDVETVAERGEPHRTQRHGQMPRWRGLTMACIERVFCSRKTGAQTGYQTWRYHHTRK